MTKIVFLASRKTVPSLCSLNSSQSVNQLENVWGTPYACGECKAQFVYYNSWYRHRHGHTNNIYDCEWCDQLFATAQDIKDHIIANHRDKINIYRCDECSTKFSVFVLYNYHKEQHRFKKKKRKENRIPTKWINRTGSNFQIQSIL